MANFRTEIEQGETYFETTLEEFKEGFDDIMYTIAEEMYLYVTWGSVAVEWGESYRFDIVDKSYSVDIEAWSEQNPDEKYDDSRGWTGADVGMEVDVYTPEGGTVKYDHEQTMESEVDANDYVSAFADVLDEFDL